MAKVYKGDIINNVVELSLQEEASGGGMISGITKNSGDAENAANRSNLNFIEGANVTIIIADDEINDRVDVSIASSGGSDFWFY